MQSAFGPTGTGIDLGIDGLRGAVLVGQGGFGAVYRAEQPALGRTVAVKILTAPGLDHPTRERFERECVAVGALSGHPHIVTVHDSGINSWGRPFIVMDFMSRGSIADRVRSGGSMSWPEAVDSGVKICSAVATAHAAGILHRDIKPQNVLVSEYGEPKLGDFGISSIGAEQTSSGHLTASLEHAGPELLEGSPATVASDVFAVASTIFTMVAGEAPFTRGPEEPVQSLITRIVTGRVPDLRPRGIPGTLCNVLERALSKDPLARYSSSAELASALRSVQEDQGLVPTPFIGTETVGGFEVLDRFAPGGTGTTAPTRARVRNGYEPRLLPSPRVPVSKRPLLLASVVALVLALGATSLALTRRDDPAPIASNDVAGETAAGAAEERVEEPQPRGRKNDDPRRERTRGNRRRGHRTDGTAASYGSSSAGAPSLATGAAAPGAGAPGTSRRPAKGTSDATETTSGGEREPVPPPPPAPDLRLFHAYKERNHIMYTDAALSASYYDRGFKIETLGGVYSYEEEGTRAISVGDRTLWVFRSDTGRTSPSTEREEIWFMSSTTDDDFYTSDEGLTTYYYARGWAQRRQVGWVAS